MRCYCFAITPHHGADDDALQRVLVHTFLDFWATFPHPARIMSMLRPAGFEPRLRELARAQRAGGSHTHWRARWFLDMRRTLQDWGEGGTALTLEHYLLVWVPDDEPLPTLTTRIAEHFAATVTLATVPTLPGGPWEDKGRMLVPTEPGDPYLAVLTAHNIHGKWNLTSWQRLFSLPFPLTLVLDVRTMAKHGIGGLNRKVTDAYGTLEAVVGKQTQLDSRTRKALRQAATASDLLDEQTIHQLGYLIRVEAPTPQELTKRLRDVDATIGAKVETVALPSVQLDLLQFFTSTPTGRIKLHIPRRNTMSEGVAYKTPFAIQRSAAVEGTLWGIDQHTGLPVHRALGLERKQNGHAVIWGKSGFGKTVFQQVMLNRQAMEGTQVVLMEPAFNSWRLRDAIGDTLACHYVEVAQTPAINLLDPSSTDPAAQRDKVVRGLEVALGRLVHDGDDEHVMIRELSQTERGVIDTALRHRAIYGEQGEQLHAMTCADAPLLQDLLNVLRELIEDNSTDDGLLPAADAARCLEYEIRTILLGTAAHVFNRRTEIRLNWSADAQIFSFSDIDKGKLPIIYDHVLTQIDRYVRTARNRPLLADVDELKYMATVTSMYTWLANSTKTWRNFYGALWSADQNPQTYLGRGQDVEKWGSGVTENVAYKAVFRLDSTGADVVGRAFRGQWGEQHIAHLRALSPGYYLADMGGVVRKMQFELTPLERAYFLRKEPNEHVRSLPGVHDPQRHVFDVGAVRAMRSSHIPPAAASQGATM